MKHFLKKAQGFLSGRSKDRKDSPNIVMILLDQFRNDARSAHPIFEEMKQRGVLFSQMITYAPYTLASLHATFTGMYGRQNGVDAYTKSPNFDAKGCYTLPQYLQDVGYYTRGYTFSSILIPHSGFESLSVVPEDEETDVLKSHLSELDACFAQDNPFFSYLHYGEIHHEVVRNVIRKYDDFSKEYFDHIDQNTERYRNYAAEAGKHTSEILQYLDEKDPDGNTFVIVLTDHGAGLGEKPGEKAYGIFTYDYSICVWLYLLWPKRLPQGMEIPCQIRSVDILPTVIDLLDMKPVKRAKPIMGQSLLPIIEGQESDHRLAFSETGGVEGPYPSPNNPNICTVRDGKWKLIFNRTSNKFELFDVESDPTETKNLHSEYPETAARLWNHLVEYL
jgi:arylsulfatase A-like enzyme